VQRSERTSGDADPGPGDLDHPNDAGVRAVPAAGGAGRQAARAGGVHHAAEVTAAGVVEPPPHHGHHDVKGQGRDDAPEVMVPDSLWQWRSRVRSGRAKLQFYEVGASFFR
jgi:hypothetical protein